MSREERVNVSIECDRFFLTINKFKNSSGIFNVLKKELGLARKYDKELWMIITLVGKSLRSGCKGSQIPMKNDTYVTANKEHQLGLNKDRAKHVILEMEINGYLDFYSGFKDFKHDIAIMSCVTFKDKLTNLFPESVVSRYARNITKDEMVEIKDSVTKQVIAKLTRFKGVGKHKDFMFEYNSLLAIHDIRYGSKRCQTVYKQIFSDDLDKGGRIYSFGTFQTMRSEMRQKLTIDGEITTECDLKANHISQLYLIHGIKLEEDFDCYSIYLEGYEHKDTRNICKMAVMCLINCKSKVAASKALEKIVKEDRDDREGYLKMFPVGNEDFYNEVINKLINKHKRIKFFNKGETLWQKMQRLDSKVCEYVLEHFTNKGEVVLGWHDSWICRRSLRQELIDTIREGWYSVFGTYDNCFIKVEF